jgi:hypothetical protein
MAYPFIFNPAAAGRALILCSLLRCNEVHSIPRQLAARWLINFMPFYKLKKNGLQAMKQIFFSPDKSLPENYQNIGLGDINEIIITGHCPFFHHLKIAQKYPMEYDLQINHIKLLTLDNHPWDKST